MILQKNGKCPICGLRMSFLTHKGASFLGRYRRVTCGDYFYKVCGYCNHMVLDIPKEVNLGYQKDYRRNMPMNGDIVNGELGKSYYSNRREILRKRVERIGDFVEKGMTIFEIGCGGGYLLEYYKKKGHSVAGVEIDDLCVNACRHLGIDCVDGDFLEMEVRKRWGAVMAWHALEHSDDINEFMRKVVEMTNGGSLVFIEVPTGRGPVENWELYDGHVHYFSRKSLKRLTDKFGLSCLHLGEGIQKPAMLYIGKVDETIF